MFGVEKRVKRVQATIVNALQAKSLKIMNAHADKKPADIPWLDVARSSVFMDLAEIIQNLGVEELSEDKE